MRRLLISLAMVLAMAAGSSFLAWRWVVGQMQTQFAAWVAAQQAQGWTVAHGEPGAGGWPFAAELILPDLSLTGLAADIPGGIAWSGERTTLRVDVLSPRLLTVLVGGGQRLRIGANAPVSYAADRFTLSVPLPPDGPPLAMALDAGGLQATGGLTIGLLEGQFEQQPAARATSIRLSAEAIAFPPPPAPQPPLGPHIASATVEGTLTGTISPTATDPAAAAIAWQAAGGKLEVRRIALGWGPLGVSGTAAVELDPALQPVGTAALHIVGYADALQALAAGHVLSPHAAQAAAAVLGLLAVSPSGGGVPAVDVPLALHDRTLSMGHIPLARLPELVWPSTVGSVTVLP